MQARASLSDERLPHLSLSTALSPIRLIRNAAFDPETTALMGLAYEKAILDCADEPARELIARRIIEAARRGERDLDRLAAYGRQGSNDIADA
jgi:hypothetical protein